MKVLYQDTPACVRTDRPGFQFSLYRDVKQGDPLSPNLFNAVLEQIFRKLEWAKKGIKIDGIHLNYLRHADDIVLISEDREKVQGMLGELFAEIEKAGLTVNISKTKVMSNTTRDGICIGDKELESVEEYPYLGQIMSFKGKMKKKSRLE